MGRIYDAGMPVRAVRRHRLFISNTATAVLMAPIALAAAKSMGVSPHPFADMVAMAASAAFMAGFIAGQYSGSGAGKP